MKRKAPETLLEFSDYYLHPATKKFKFTPEPLEPLVFSSQPMREYAYESDFHSSPVSSPSYHNSCESDSAEEVAASPPQRRRSNSVESIGDFSLEEFLAQDPLADKPSNSRKPLKSLVHAIRWITENKRVLQKEISDAVGVSPSTMSLYMNNTPRQHGWKQFERKMVDWMRSTFNAKQHLTPRSLPMVQKLPSTHITPSADFGLGWNQEEDYSSYFTRIPYQPYYYPETVFQLELNM